MLTTTMPMDLTTTSSAALLDQLSEEVREIVRQTQGNLATQSAQALNRKPGPDRWSAAECLEHLNRYTAFYLPEIEQRMERAKARGWEARTTFQSGWLGRLSVKAVHPDNAKPSKTRPHLDPARSEVAPDGLETFLRDQRRLLTLLEAARKADLQRVRIPIEIARYLSLRLGDMLRFIVAHEQRHLRQAQRALEA